MARASVAVFVALGVCLLPRPAHAGPLRGSVRSAAGAGISGAQVVAHDPRGDQTATTDPDGAFSFADVTLPVSVDVTASGYESVHRVIRASPAEVTLPLAGVVESVVVSSARAPAWRDPDSGATVLSAADLALLPAVTLDESLRAVSGFSLYRRTSAVEANPTTDGVTMRGLSASGASRGLILLDGVPLNDGFGGWVTWTRLPTDAVGQVDVDRGSAGDLYGSDALGGVIRIVSPDVDRAMATVGLNAGSMGVWGLDLAGGLRRGRLSFFGASSGFRTNGSIPTAPAERGPVDVSANASWANAFGRMDVQATTSQHVTIEGWGGQDDRGNGTPLERNRMTGGTIAGTYSAVMGETSFTARGSDSPNSFDQTFSTVSATRATETLTSTQVSDTSTARAIVELGHTYAHVFAMVRGTFSRDSGTFTDTERSTAATKDLVDDTEAVSTEVGWTPAGRLTVNAGAREEWRAAPIAGSSYQSAMVGHVGAVWQIASPLSFRTTASTSHRWPTLNELVRNFEAGNVFTLANPSLVAEQATSFDAGLFVTRPFWLLSVGGFDSTIDNAVENVTQPAGTVKGFSGIVRLRENAGQARAHGLELDGEVRPTRAVRLRASTTFLRTVLENSPELALDGNRLPQVPAVSASLSGDVALPHAISASFVWHAVSSQFDDDRNQFLIAPGYQLDVRVAGRAGPTEWQAIVDNVFDNQIETGHVSATLFTVAPGRAFRIGLTVRK